jgi:hypothetical protein
MPTSLTSNWAPVAVVMVARLFGSMDTAAI